MSTASAPSEFSATSAPTAGIKEQASSTTAKGDGGASSYEVFKRRSINQRVVLLGDLHTERRGFHVRNGGWAAHLANEYSETCDVVTRGHGYYNSENIKKILPLLFPIEKKDAWWTPIRIFSVLLGSNDAIDETDGGHVDLDKFVENIRTILKYLQEYAQRQEEDTDFSMRIVVIRPPPVNDIAAVKQHRQSGARGPVKYRLELVSQYADACGKVAEDMKVPCLDFFTEVCRHPGGIDDRFVPAAEKGPAWGECLNGRDGVHLSRIGNHLLSEKFMDLVRTQFPELTPERLGHRSP